MLPYAVPLRSNFSHLVSLFRMALVRCGTHIHTVIVLRCLYMVCTWCWFATNMRQTYDKHVYMMDTNPFVFKQKLINFSSQSMVHKLCADGAAHVRTSIHMYAHLYTNCSQKGWCTSVCQAVHDAIHDGVMLLVCTHLLQNHKFLSSKYSRQLEGALRSSSV